MQEYRPVSPLCTAWKTWWRGKKRSMTLDTEGTTTLPCPGFTVCSETSSFPFPSHPDPRTPNLQITPSLKAMQWLLSLQATLKITCPAKQVWITSVWALPECRWRGSRCRRNSGIWRLILCLLIKVRCCGTSCKWTWGNLRFRGSEEKPSCPRVQL